MFDAPVRTIMQKEVLVTASGTMVVEAARLMAARKVGAIVVVEDGRLTGIFTERDLLCRVVARGLDPKTTPLEKVMTRAPKTVEPGAPFGYALAVMQENGFRHLPVVEDGCALGIVSSRSAMDPELEEFRSESSRRQYWRKAARGKA